MRWLCPHSRHAALLLLWIWSTAVQSFAPDSRITTSITRPCPSSTTTTRLAAGRPDYLIAVRTGIQEAGHAEEWEAAVAHVVTAVPTLDSAAAEDVLAQAWNWKRWAVVTSPLARKYIKVVPPDAAAVARALTWLREGPLALDDDDVLAVALKEHAAVYLGASPEATYAQALAVAPSKYKDDPERFRQTLLRDPSVLGCTTNCVKTGCDSNCGNCWVSFALR
jgi:hypothetical protein